MLSIVLGQAILAVEPNIRNSNLFPVNANGEVLFLSVVSFLNDGNTLTSISRDFKVSSLYGRSSSTHFNTFSKSVPINIDNIAGGASFPPKRWSFPASATDILSKS